MFSQKLWKIRTIRLLLLVKNKKGVHISVCHNRDHPLTDTVVEQKKHLI